MKGKKTGGRSKGTPNKRSEEQARAVEESGLTPLEYLLSVMRDPGQEQDARVEAAKAAAPYVHPKLAAVELTGKDGGPVRIVASPEDEAL